MASDMRASADLLVAPGVDPIHDGSVTFVSKSDLFGRAYPEVSHMQTETQERNTIFANRDRCSAAAGSWKITSRLLRSVVEACAYQSGSGHDRDAEMLHDKYSTENRALEAIRQELVDSDEEELERGLEDDRLKQLAVHLGHAHLDRKVYYRELLRLQHELVCLQDWLQNRRLRVVNRRCGAG